MDAIARAEWETEEGLTLLRGWKMNGLTDKQISENMGINRNTLHCWKNESPSINDALKKGKDACDYTVENALFRRAVGYDVTETKGDVKSTRHIPPDVTACIFWLKCRASDRWRDKPVEEHGTNALAEAIREAYENRMEDNDNDRTDRGQDPQG